MSSPPGAVDRTADDTGQTLEGDANNCGSGDILEGIDACLRRWKAARREGQVVLAGLSNALLLRTYAEQERGASASHVWGALSSAGTAVPRVALAIEARARRLHEDLSALQDAMVAAAAGVRRHAQEARRQCYPEREAAPLDGCAAPASPMAAWKGGTKATSTSSVAAVVGGGYAMEDVADAASEVSEMLLREALVTATVVHRVGECQDDRHALTMYAAAWMMQPYLDTGRVSDLEVMVGARRRKSTLP